MVAGKKSDSATTKNGESIYIGRALPCEYQVVLNAMPPAWFESNPSLLHIQVAGLISASRFLIAQRGSTLLGGVAWQDDIAFGAFYAKLLFVREQYRRSTIAVRLLRELVLIAKDAQARAVFADLPENSPLREVADAFPGAREVGNIEDFCEPGLKSIIFQIDLRDTERLLRHADRLIAGASTSETGQIINLS
jgi:hypothetical protein